MMKANALLVVFLVTALGACRAWPEGSSAERARGGSGAGGSAAGAEDVVSGREVETGFAEVNGTRLYYEVAGAGEPVVLIHGNFGDGRYYDGQFDVLAERHRVLRYDLRGYGRSAKPEEGVPYADSDDLAALLGELGIERAHIAGFSLGSAIAVDFCLAFPDRCRSLIAIGPWFHGYDSPLARRLFEDFGAISAAAMDGGRRAALEQLLGASWWYPERVHPRAFEAVRVVWSDYEFWHFENPDPRRVFSPSAAQRLEQISTPTLIITAEYDLDACRAVARELEARIPDSRRVELAGGTHFMFIESPDEVNAALFGFLGEASGRRHQVESRARSDASTHPRLAAPR